MRDQYDMPPVSTVLVEALRLRFPAITPSLDRTLRDYDHAAGIEKVLGFLEAESKKVKGHVPRP